MERRTTRPLVPVLAVLLIAGCHPSVESDAPDGGSPGPAAACPGAVWRTFDTSGHWVLEGMDGVPGGGFLTLGSSRDVGDVVDLGSGPVTLTGTNLFLAQLDATGQAVWTKPLGQGALYEQEGGLAVGDGMGNLVLSGEVMGTVDLGGGAIASEGDRITAKLDAHGDVLWSHAFQAWDTVDLIAAGGGGRVALASGFTETMNVGGVSLTANPSALPSYVAMLDASGEILYARQIGDPTSTGEMFGLAVGPAGELAACGPYQGSVTLGGTTLTSGSNSSYVASLDPSGGPRWLVPIENAQPVGVAFSGEDVIVVGGSTPGASIGGVAIPPAPTGDRSSFVVRLDPAGNVRWVETLQGAGATGVGVDGDGDLVIVGRVKSPAQLGGVTLPAPASWTAYLMKLDPEGGLRCVTVRADAPPDTFQGGAIGVTASGYATATATGEAAFAAMPVAPP
jgi:hypothetical protein